MEFGANEYVGTEEVSMVDETLVDEEIPVPLGKVREVLPPLLLLGLGYGGEYGGGTEY